MMTTDKNLVRIAGLFYLIVAVTGGFSELVVRDSLIEAGNAAATADNIATSAGLFRIAFASDLVNITFFVLAALALHALFRTIDSRVALAMVVFNAVAAAIMSVNMINHFAALRIATSAGESDALVMLFADMHSSGYGIAQIFFGLWLLPLGYLVYKSGFLPRALGVALMVGAFSYLTELLAGFLFPDLSESLLLAIAMPAALAEVSLIIWLLVKGIKTRPDLRPTPIAA
jgi:hypothetical protein